MIARLIRWSLENRFLVLLATLLVAAWGVWAVSRTPLDALPDLSDVQVIIRTPYPGQAPRIVENQITYPLTTTMLSVPGAKTVRGYSFFGDSFVYVLFEDGTDLYWARSRVLEYLNQVQSRLPQNVQPSLGPDATGVGWIYEYALVDRTGRHDLSQLRALQDWFLKYELKAVPNVAEVATLGGAVRQYQVVLQPDRLRAYGITHRDVIEAIRGANQEAGGSVLELAEAEYVVRATGYLKGLDDFRKIPLAHRRRRRAGAARRCGASAARARAAPRNRGARRRGRGDRRHHRDALRKERARDHRGGEAQDRAAEAGLARRRRDRRDLRPLAADPALGAQSHRQAGRGIHRRRARVLCIPVSPALGVGRNRLPAARACSSHSSSCTTRGSTRTSCRSVASRLRSARWSMPRSS